MAAALFWGLFIVCFVALILTQNHQLTNGGRVMIGLFSLVSFYYVYELIQEVRRLWVDHKKGVVLCLDGELEKIWKPRMKTHSYYFKVKDVDFEVTRQAYDVVVEGKNYKMYYVPKSQKLVSLEEATS